ncbi:MAG: SEC-C metal-binding domain-containing protein [Nitrosomonadaceae bacterium]|nr:SEC-C metal-binding domain-containing protein [Nitrosomonadaceae bacterium]
MNETRKIGRNDPCPCGSGKKYKQCCLKTEQAPGGEDFLWHRIRRVIEGSPAQLLNFADSHFGQGALLEAWEEFIPWEDEPFTPDTPHMHDIHAMVFLRLAARSPQHHGKARSAGRTDAGAGVPRQERQAS